jgi:hypothetical protein
MIPCALALMSALPEAAVANDGLVVYEAVPSHIDPAVRHFDEPNVAITNSGLTKNAPLVVFMPGTGGKPANAIDLLKVVAGQGYRVIGLEYDDTPAVVQRCPQSPDPDCSAAFREMRAYGNGDKAPVSNPPAESIVSRLVAMLRALNEAHPGEGWVSILIAMNLAGIVSFYRVSRKEPGWRLTWPNNMRSGELSFFPALGTSPAQTRRLRLGYPIQVPHP